MSRARLADSDPRGPVSDAVFRAVFDSSPRPLLLMAADPPRFTMLAANAAHALAFGATREALEGRGVFEVFPPNPDPNAMRFIEAIRASLEAAVASGSPHQMPVGRLAVRRDDGESVERFWTAVNTPLRGADGEIAFIVSATQDMTGEVYERRSEAARNLLMREVDHRARNALTVVQSLVRLSTADSADELRGVLEGRIESLARAQTSLAARKWEGALLGDIVRGALGAIATPERWTAEGPRVVLPPNDVQALSMIVHELATNAAKYGAFAQPAAGQLAVAWSRAADRRVRLVWREDGCSDVGAPRASGFGARLVARLAAQLRGEVEYDWRTSGLVACLSFPLGSATPSADLPPRPEPGGQYPAVASSR
jgi:PAS domain S-box-containing protein